MFRIEIISDQTKAENYFHELLEIIYTEDQLKLKTSKPYLGNYLNKSIVVFQDETICAFASLFINNDLGDDAISIIGNFECIEDPKAFKELMDVFEKECLALQLNTIIGPMNGSTWEKYRLSLVSSQPIFLTEDIYPNYYEPYLIENGFEEYEEYISSKQSITNSTVNQFDWLDSFNVENNFSFKYVSKQDYLSELPRIYDFCSLSFAGNKLYSPISKADFIEKYTLLQSLIHPISVLLLENSEKNIVGLLLSIPNYYHENELILKTMAVHPDYRSRGIGKALGAEIIKSATEHSFKTLIHAFMHVNNHSKNVSEKYQGEVIRKYVLYKKSI